MVSQGYLARIVDTKLFICALSSKRLCVISLVLYIHSVIFTTFSFIFCIRFTFDIIDGLHMSWRPCWRYNTKEYRVSKKRLMPFIFKLAANLLLEFVCSYVYSQHDVVNIAKKAASSIQISTIKMHFNSHMGLDLCFN